eukprot:Gb_32910 [translate_table: standard]
MFWISKLFAWILSSVVPYATFRIVKIGINIHFKTILVRAVVVSIDPRRVYLKSPNVVPFKTVKLTCPGPNAEKYAWYQCTLLALNTLSSELAALKVLEIVFFACPRHAGAPLAISDVLPPNTIATPLATSVVLNRTRHKRLIPLDHGQSKLASVLICPLPLETYERQYGFPVSKVRSGIPSCRDALRSLLLMPLSIASSDAVPFPSHPHIEGAGFDCEGSLGGVPFSTIVAENVVVAAFGFPFESISSCGYFGEAETRVMGTLLWTIACIGASLKVGTGAL